MIRSARDITTENVHQVVPESKFDTNQVDLLEQVDPRIWTSIVPDLIDWTCDPDWPSSWAILPLLRSNPITIAAAIPSVSTMLRKTGPPRSGSELERDDEHQNVLLVNFVMKIDVAFQREMIQVLEEFRLGVTDELEEDYSFRESVDEILTGIKRDEAS